MLIFILHQCYLTNHSVTLAALCPVHLGIFSPISRDGTVVLPLLCQEHHEILGAVPAGVSPPWPRGDHGHRDDSIQEW